MHDLIIVGGGPAALAAAAYALEKQLDLRVIAENVGGKVGVSHGGNGHAAAEPNVSEAAAHLFERAVSAGTHRVKELVLRDRALDIIVVEGGFELTTQRHGLQQSRTVIVATGVTPITLDVPGARQWLGYGLGYSATTYAPMVAGKTVAVIGGTIRALRGAAELARTVAQLYLILPDAAGIGSQLLERLRERSNVVILAGYRVTELLGGDQLERLAIVREDEQAFVPADAVYADLGLLPHSEMVRRIATVDEDGFIAVDAHQASTVPGLFAAGDVTTAFSEQIVMALGDGTRAAVSAYDYLLAEPMEHAAAPTSNVSP
jgi:thioredoxin reductase